MSKKDAQRVAPYVAFALLIAGTLFGFSVYAQESSIGVITDVEVQVNEQSYVIDCAFVAFGEAVPNIVKVGEGVTFRSVAENVSPGCTGKWVHEWDWNNDGTWDFTSAALPNQGNGKDHAYGTAGTYKAVNRIRNVDTGQTEKGTPFTVTITKPDTDSGGGASGTPNPPSCPIPVNKEAGDILISFDEFADDALILANQGFLKARLGPVNTDISKGNYKVQLASYDNHTDKPGQNQKKEQWFLRLRNGSDVVVGQSKIAPDLPEEPTNSKYWTVNTTNNPMVISGHGAVAYGFHATWSQDNPYPESESVRPLCAVLTPIPDVEPEPPSCSMDIDPTLVLEGGSAELSWTSENADTAVIDHGVGPVSVNDSQEVGPIGSTTTYTGVFTGPGGVVECDATVHVHTGDPTADVSIEKSVTPDSGPVGTIFTYTLDYANEGVVDAGNAFIVDLPIPAARLNGFSITDQSEHGSCSANQNGITCNLGILPVGEGGIIKYTAEGVEVGLVDNIAVIETSTPESDYTNNDDTARVQITEVPDEPFCPLEADEQNGDILIDFLGSPSGMFANGSAADATQGPVYEDVPEGEYRVTLASYDGHSLWGGQNQQEEKWFLRFHNDQSDVVATSGVSDDIPENSNFIVTVVDEALAVPSGVTELTSRHAAYPANGPESVRATCALLEPLTHEEDETNVYIEKEVTPSGGLIGTVFTYTLSYGNNGDYTATDVTIVDTPDPDNLLDTYTVITQPVHNGNDPDDACSFTGSVLNCSLGDLESGESGTIEYTATAIAQGTIDNEAVIETITPETTLADNSDTARVSVTSGESDTTDIGILKSVDPGSGKKFDTFTYTLTYENFGPLQAANSRVEDRFQEVGILHNIHIIKQPEHSGVDPQDDACVVHETNGEEVGIDCDLGTLVFGDTGTIVYEAEATVDEAVLDNIVVISTTSDEENLANNQDDARISISNGGGGCTSNCGGGGPRVDTVLFRNPGPQVLGTSVLLAQVPYTGVGSIVGIILFFAAILIAAGIITYVVLKRRRVQPARFSVMPENIEISERTADDALYQEYAEAPDPVAVPENLPVEPVVSEAQAPAPTVSEKTYDASVLEEAARSQQVLLSQDAAAVILAQGGGDINKARGILDKVIVTSRGRYPTEDGWLPLNRSRVADILFASNLSTTPLFVQWLVEGNSNKVFSFLRSITKQGKTAEEFLTKILYELDSVYQSRLEGTQAAGAVAEIVRPLSIRELEHIIESLTRAIDGGYSSGMTGAKVALARILDLQRVRKIESNIPQQKSQEHKNIAQ